MVHWGVDVATIDFSVAGAAMVDTTAVAVKNWVERCIVQTMLVVRGRGIAFIVGPPSLVIYIPGCVAKRAPNLEWNAHSRIQST